MINQIVQENVELGPQTQVEDTNPLYMPCAWSRHREITMLDQGLWSTVTSLRLLARINARPKKTSGFI
jgi:hypothetical protein